jgi:hypothetical protein
MDPRILILPKRLLFLIPGLLCIFLSALGGQSKKVEFTHEVHEFAADCIDCHAGILEGSQNNSFPTKQDCLNCHSDMEEASFLDALNKYLNSRKFQSRYTSTRADINFKHPVHMKEDSGLDCESCHQVYLDQETTLKNPSKRSAPITRRLPTTANNPHPLHFNHRNCLDCHQRGVKAPLKCISCHQVDPFKSLSSHRFGWLERHGAQLNEMTREETRLECFLCHRENECINCHKGEKPKSHTGSWKLLGHALAVDMDRAQCSACHTPDYCVSCHLETPPRSHGPNYKEQHCTQCHGTVGENPGCIACHKIAIHNVAPLSHTRAFRNTNHCVGCHLPLSQNTNPGSSSCVFCHQQAPHTTANRRPQVIDRFGPAKWSPHFAPDDTQCITCHLDGGGVGATLMKHPNIGSCFTCHFLE